MPTLSAEESLLLHDVARIYIADDGGPVRRVLTGRQRKPTGLYASAKARRSLPWESRVELHFFLRCEVDTNVVSYAAQPHRLDLLVDGRQAAYYPDVSRLLSDGTTEIVELKKSAREVQHDADYKRKLEAAKSIYTGLGWRFSIRDRDSIEYPSVVFSNIKDVEKDGKLAIPAADQLAVLQHLRQTSGHVSTMGSLAELLGGWVRGSALLKSMMVHRIVAIDLDHPIIPSTRVVPVTSSPSSGLPGVSTPISGQGP